MLAVDLDEIKELLISLNGVILIFIFNVELFHLILKVTKCMEGPSSLKHSNYTISLKF